MALERAQGLVQNEVWDSLFNLSDSQGRFLSLHTLCIPHLGCPKPQAVKGLPCDPKPTQSFLEAASASSREEGGAGTSWRAATQEGDTGKTAWTPIRLSKCLTRKSREIGTGSVYVWSWRSSFLGFVSLYSMFQKIPCEPEGQGRSGTELKITKYLQRCRSLVGILRVQGGRTSHSGKGPQPSRLSPGSKLPAPKTNTLADDIFME